ncbi:hypothetical protein [Streptomyces filamentosus]|uniref:hypothetical protein n=1 Tax=Streptomyces filamentosus TaxID=67294 RepID=UPI0033CA54C5
MSAVISEARAAAPAAAEGPPPHADAATVDRLGRPLCDGTTHRGTRNCDKLADFKLERPGEEGAPDYACEGHVGQVASFQNGGESGPEREHRLIQIRTKE